MIIKAGGPRGADGEATVSPNNALSFSRKGFNLIIVI